MSRLIIISNRVSPATGEGGGNQGGLAVALSTALRESNGIWFGWSGEETENFTGAINFQRSDGVATATIDLEAQDIDEYYNGFANQTLWPLFHYRIDLAEFERGFAGGYERVNARFADTVSPLLEQDDLIWVHDYHLMPLGRELRRREFVNRMGFFLHIPWPPMRLLISLPSHRELVDSLFSYDVLGFQTRDSLEAFMDYVTGQLGDEAIVHDDSTVSYLGRRVRLLACPIGVDCESFREASHSEPARRMQERMRISANGRTMIIGVDRLDYSKGLAERFLGYERLLSSRADLHGQIFLLQIAPPSRGEVQSYQEIRASLDNLSGRINGEFSDAEWVPLRYVNRGYPRDQLAGMYRAARVGLVTPLRDGMNLVAKEYVVAQDEADPGVLILSRFAGAAEQLTDALLVNPHSPEEVADAIAQALVMPLAERQRRWRAMFEVIGKQDVMWWWREFTRVLEEVDEPAAG
ncbi:MAG TPA: trehalose-6-phosphate synthase [Sphingobium sp.]|uniref:alpha,alpha-trehalose-phosphate synthase (UDP-forming) n=1 Tax=Sphingobium sp. TaxID=1912891 RepID=UPI002ECFDDCF